MLVTDSVFLLPFPYSYMMILAVVCFFEKTEQYLCVKRLTELDRNEPIQKKNQTVLEKIKPNYLSKNSSVRIKSYNSIRFDFLKKTFFAHFYP